MSPWSIIRPIWRNGAPISLPRPHSSRTPSSRSNRPIWRAIRRLLGARTGQVQSLQHQLDELQAKQTDRGMVLTLGDVLFETGRADLRSGADRTVSQLANFMQQNPSRTVEITGFTDSTGSVEYNQELSERRAEAVRQALMSYGISPQRVVTRGLGPALPVASNNTAGGGSRTAGSRSPFRTRRARSLPGPDPVTLRRLSGRPEQGRPDRRRVVPGVWKAPACLELRCAGRVERSDRNKGLGSKAGLAVAGAENARRQNG